jgi:hypothetical protein
MSDIEGKVAREAMSECGQRASFNVKSLGPTRFFVFPLRSLFCRLLLLLREREALGLFPAFRTFLHVISAVTVSH